MGLTAIQIQLKKDCVNRLQIRRKDSEQSTKRQAEGKCKINVKREEAIVFCLEARDTLEQKQYKEQLDGDFPKLMKDILLSTIYAPHQIHSFIYLFIHS